MRKMNVLAVRPKPGQGVYVYQLPVRIWHWTIATCIFIQFVTGYFIASPPQSIWGDATYLFDFGFILKTHYTAGLILCVFMLWRILFAFRGNAVSRQIFILPVWRGDWWRGVWGDIRWYLFLKRTPDINMGHNPLAQAAMFCAVAAISFMCLSGLGIIQAKGYAPLRLFGFMENIAYSLGGNGFDLVAWHLYGTFFMVIFVMVHVYMVIREDIMGRTTIVSTMISGERLVKATMAQDWRDLRQEEADRT